MRHFAFDVKHTSEMVLLRRAQSLRRKRSQFEAAQKGFCFLLAYIFCLYQEDRDRKVSVCHHRIFACHRGPS